MFNISISYPLGRSSYYQKHTPGCALIYIKTTMTDEDRFPDLPISGNALRG
jgi:hypothetical protein